jgi:hypothetical protein
MSDHREFVFDLKPLFDAGGGITVEYGKLKIALPVEYDSELYNFLLEKFSKQSVPLTSLQIESLADDLTLEITRYKIFNILFQNKPEIM